MSGKNQNQVLVDVWSHESNEQLVPFLCLSSNQTLDYLEAGPARVVLSPQRRSAPLQLSTRLSLAHLSTEPIS